MRGCPKTPSFLVDGHHPFFTFKKDHANDQAKDFF